MTIPNSSSLGGWLSLEEAYFHPRLWCIEEWFFFGNGLRITTSSMGWSKAVVCGGGKIRLMFVRFLISRWAGQSIIHHHQYWARKEESNFLTHSPKRSPVIQLFLWILYRQESCLMFLKHRGFVDLPIAYVGSFSPVALAAAMLSVRLCYSYHRNTFLQIGDTF